MIKAICLSLGVIAIGCADVEQMPTSTAPDAQVAPAVLLMEAPAPAPTWHAYEVDIDPQLDAARVEAILQGLSIVNDRIGREGFVAVIKKLDEPTDWHVSVSDGPGLLAEDSLGWTGGSGLNCEVLLASRFVTWQAAAHEIVGHCTDLDHTTDQTNFMCVGSGKSTVGITDDQVAQILGRLQGLR